MRTTSFFIGLSIISMVVLVLGPVIARSGWV